MRFVNYPVPTPSIANLEVQAETIFKNFISNVSSKPQKQSRYPSINSGYLEYEITSNAQIIEILRLKVALDENVYYGSTGILADAIQVVAEKAGSEF